MTPLAFEEANNAAWQELELLVARAEGAEGRGAAWDASRLLLLYRRACEHLALARSRDYPMHLVERLEPLVLRAHRLIYRGQDLGLAGLRKLLLVDFPQAVRAHRREVLAATLLFVVPLLGTAWATWRDPGFILHLLDAFEVSRFGEMYGEADRAIGRERSAATDWQMFGFYIFNNIRVAFQCFASGLLGGIGSAFYLVFNGLFAGSVGGYLVATGHAHNFLSFVVTHGAFELTAIVLAGAAGLRLGLSWLAPGRRSRLAALREGAREAAVVVAGCMALLVVAAAIEAFWSSARWVPAGAKYGVGAVCWAVVLAYLAWQGRPARSPDAG